jgi:hypothetical protein
MTDFVQGSDGLLPDVAGGLVVTEGAVGLAQVRKDLCLGEAEETVLAEEAQ